MPRICTICAHQDRAAIEAALIAGSSTRSIGSLHGIDHRAVHRHAQRHLPHAIQAAAAAHVAALDAGMIEAPRIQEPQRALQLDPLAPESSPEPETTAVAPNMPSSTPLAALGIVASIEDLRDRVLGILASAEAGGDAKTALQAIREARSILETLARMEPPEASLEVPSLAESPEWDRARTALLTALQPFPEARVAAAAALIQTGALS